MKRISFLATAFVALFFSACQEGDPIESTGISASTEANLSSEAALSSTMEDVDLLAEGGMEVFETGSRGARDYLLECAEIENDTVNKVVTIDFGDGCEDKDGTLRSGKIFIEYNYRKHVPGAYRIITFEDFFIDSVGVEGVRSMTNVTDTTSEDSGIAFETTLVGGKLTFPDGTTITREAAHLRTLYKGAEWQDQYATLTGEASGTLQDGTAYSCTILEALVYKRACRGGGVRIPVAGIKEIMIGERTVLMDFGDGECDRLVDVTTDGVTETIELEPRDGRPHRAGRNKGGRHGMG